MQIPNLAPLHGKFAGHVAFESYVFALGSDKMPYQPLTIRKNEHIRLCLGVQADKGQQAYEDEGNSLSS